MSFQPQLSQQDLAEMIEQSSATPNSGQHEIDPPLNCPHEVLRDYILSMKDGERVREMGKSALTGLEGTIYHNAEGVTCIMWDREPGDEGQMGTSFTGGARRISPATEQSSATPSHGIVSAYRDSEGWVMYGADQEPIEVWPEHWTERVTKEFLLSQGVEVDGEKRNPEQSSPAQSSTPRTDGILNMLKITWKTDTGYEHFVCAKEAAKIGIEDLETELTAALRERDEANAMLRKIQSLSLGPNKGSSGWIAEQSYQLTKEYFKQITNHLSK